MSSSINIDFTANLARFTSSIDKATNDLSRFQSNTERISSQVNGALRNIGVGLSAAVFVGFTKGIIDSADALLDLSKSTGVAIETLGGFKLAAEQSGVELETVARGIQKFSAAIFAGSEGTEKSLSRLGLSLQELKQQSPEEQFFSLAKALEGVAKEQRPAVVIDLLGQKLAGLVPLLDDGADGLRAMTEEGKKANRGLTDLGPAADQFNDQLAKLKQTSTGLFATLVSDSLPSLNEYLISMKAIVESGTWLEKLAFFSTGYTSGRIADKANDPVEQVRRYTEEIKKLKGELENINPLLDRSGKKRAKSETQAELAIAEAGLATQEARVRFKNQLAAEKIAADSLSKKSLGGDSSGEKASAKADADAKKRLEFIKGLQKEVSTLGANEGQKKLFDAYQLGITGKALEQVRALSGRIDEYKTSIDNAKIANQNFEDSFSEVERNRESIESVIGAFRKQNEQIAAEASLIGATSVERETAIRLRDLEAVGLSKYSQEWIKAGDAIKKASETSRLDNLIGGAGFSKLKQDQEDAILLTKAFTDGIQQADGSLRKLSETEYLDAVSTRLGLLSDKTKETDDLAKQLGITFTSAFEDALVGGKDVRSVVQSLAQDLLKLTIRKSLTEPLFEAAAAALKFAQAGNSSSSGSGLFGSIISGIGAFFGGGGGGGAGGGGFGGATTIAAANGGVFGGQGGLSAYSGSVVSSPTLFKFASGTGLMGEAGPEAILPLKRGSDGKLGVRLAGGGGGGGGYIDNRVYNIDARGADAGVEERIRRAIRDGDRESVNQAVSQVLNLNQRGQLRLR